MHNYWQLLRQAVALGVYDTAINDKDSYYVYFHEKCGLSQDISECRTLAMFLTLPASDTPNGKDTPRYRASETPRATSRKVIAPATHTTHTAHVSAPALPDVSYQSIAMQALTDLLAIGADSGLVAISLVASYRYDLAALIPDDASDTQTSVAKTIARDDTPAYNALYKALLVIALQCPRIADMRDRLASMTRHDLAKYAATAGSETPQDKSTGNGLHSPRVATYAGYVLASTLVMCNAIVDQCSDVASVAQLDAFYAWQDSDATLTRTLKRARHQYREMSNKLAYYAMDADTKRVRRAVISRAFNRRQKGFRHH